MPQSLPILLLASLSACLSLSAADEKAEAVRQLDKRWAGIAELKPRLGVRDLFAFALEAVANDYHPEHVERAFELARQMQDREPKNRTYGNFKWYWGGEKPDDLNAAEFCMQQGVLIWMFHRDKLTPGARNLLEELMRFGAEGVKRRGVKPGYTNIFLMHIWNLCALGEALAGTDSQSPNSPKLVSVPARELAEEGRRAFDEWLLYTWKNGISEYVSTTYYGVDLDCLGLLARHIKDEQVRKKAEAALRLFWTDIAANWFEPAQRLGGAHSRDYDYLTGHGSLDTHLRLAGWLPDATHGKDAVAPRGVFIDLLKWTPPPEIRAQFAGLLPRVICQHFGEKPWEVATHYLGRTISLGSAGACKGPEDKVFTINFAGGPKMVMCNLVMDGRKDPYGVNKSVTGGGHMKSHHLTPFVASVQRGPEVLLLASDNSKSRKEGSVEWQMVAQMSHLVLPSEVQVWIKDQPAQPPAADKERELAAAEPIFLRYGDAAAGLRYLVTRGTDGQPAPLRWVNDGAQHKAMRLTCAHSETPPQGRGIVAFWVRVAEGLDDAAFARFRRDFAAAQAQTDIAADRVELTAAGLSGPLHLVADVAKGERKANEGGEQPPAGFLLSVNGREFAREILKEAQPNH